MAACGVPVLFRHTWSVCKQIAERFFCEVSSGSVPISPRLSGEIDWPVVNKGSWRLGFWQLTQERCLPQF